MRIWVAVGVAPLMLVSACQKAEDIGSSTGSGPRGRYAGVGVYEAGRMWPQLVRAGAPQDAAGATLKDDEKIIVVIDARTGELRQCGNLSGYCVGMNPWSRPLGTGQAAPAPVAKHLDQLLQEDEVSAQRAASRP
jgi:hypothetical protein